MNEDNGGYYLYANDKYPIYKMITNKFLELIEEEK